MKVSRLYILFASGLFFLSCKKEMDREEYVQYITNPENGMRKDISIGDFEISALYEPTDFIIEREFRDDYSSAQIQSRRTELDRFNHFQFRIKLKEGGDILSYSESLEANQQSRVNYLSFQVKNDFILISGGDTSQCIAAVYSRNYSLTPTVDLTLSFEKKVADSDIQLIYTDTQFEIGRVKFLFKEDDLEDLPSLKI